MVVEKNTLLRRVKAMDELSPMHKRFVEEYIVDLNGAQAAIRAGYSPKGSRQQSSLLLTNPNIHGAIEDALHARGQRTKITADRVLRELGKIAFSDIRNATTWNENGIVFVGSEDIDDATGAAIQEISEKSTHTPGKRGEDTLVNVTLKVKMYDKIRALELCARHLGMFEGEDPDSKRRQELERLSDRELLQLVKDKLPELEKSGG